jgi:hypothetical protein
LRTVGVRGGVIRVGGDVASQPNFARHDSMYERA